MGDIIVRWRLGNCHRRTSLSLALTLATPDSPRPSDSPLSLWATPLFIADWERLELPSSDICIVSQGQERNGTHIGHIRWLIADTQLHLDNVSDVSKSTSRPSTSLETWQAPDHELNCLLYLDAGDFCLNILGNDITMARTTARD